MNLNNKIVLLTGANGGVGTQLLKQIINLDAKKVYCVVRDTNNICIKNENIEYLKADILNKKELEKTLESIDNIDLLINTAGANTNARIFEDTKKDFEVNIFGTMNVCNCLKNKLNKNSAVINITSVLALVNLPIMGLYSASKAALHSLTQALRAELKKDAIEVFEVLPGPIDTKMTDGIEMPKAKPEDIAKSILDGYFSKTYEIFPDDFSKVINKRLKEEPELVIEEFSLSVSN
ncbi:SDR family NAD(P)-dependent oxidoreductase [Arcobacter sp. CECT 8985]|uniref:SDR family NAD(P)-dependent oxidoreductase n=1 Tax=Arcobacter sp. CECT 8985 TaxID=1935424 RepID=UPI00100B4916|nr:SDR family NAD(P)-dependent oxidoreductase [Arcobacter sp. CECT 8985]RXJ87236.1 short-chain dehydrogenase [Arcobacter sp. CECT 8985]